MWDYDIEKIKGHLINLPDFTGETAVITKPSDMLAIFPLFAHYPNPELLEGYVKAACWARHTWYKNTDAVKYGVQFKFYVEEENASQILPILERNSTDIENDVIMFKGEGLESKLMAIYGDSQFDEVGWLFQIDCDLFVVNGHLDFFDMFSRRSTDWIGVIELADVDFALFGHGLVVENGMEDIVRLNYQDEWDRFVDVLIELGCTNLINRFLAIPPKIPQPISHMIAVPMNVLAKESKDWLYKAGELTYGERVIYSLFNLHFNSLWPFKGEYGIAFQDWTPAYPPRKPHIAHVVDTRTEYVFRDSIGVKDA